MLRLVALFCILGLTVVNGALPIRHEDPQVQSFQRPKVFKSEAAENVDYRLSGEVVPQDYVVTLRLENDSFDKKSFSGNVAITVKPTKDTKKIDLNYRDITINTSSVVLQKEDDRSDVSIKDTAYNNVSEIWTITTTDNLVKNTSYVLTVAYEGVLSDKSMSGFYLSSYQNKKKETEYLATTQFESTSARQAFPSFDEPELKATFQVILELDSDFYTDYSALSNTVQKSDEPKNDVTGYRTITFQPTPKMSTYLVAFIVSKFKCTESDNKIDDKKITSSACTRVGVEDDIQIALDTAPQVLTQMENYTGYLYSDSNIGKMTIVAIPDFAAGAMENWGLVTYREADVLWNEEESSAAYKQRVVTVVAHELSHQWFGDLVTLNWWTNVFLNEGFATYFEYYATDMIYPEWDLPKQFTVQEVQTAFVSDSYTTSLPLSKEVNSPQDISNRFDDISYNKGGSILRMVRYVLGLDKFKEGLAHYINTKQSANAEPVELWTILNEHFTDDAKVGTNLTVIMDNWTIKGGYPTLTVTSDDNGINITQERFLLSGDDNDKTKWYVPISYTLSSDNASVFTATTTKAWLTPDKSLQLSTVLKDAKASWIILNNQQTGYYRVDYDDKLLAKILDALSQKNFSSIDEISRAQITDDLLNFARAGKKSYTDVIKNLQFLANETSYYTWYSAFNGFQYLLTKLGDEKVQTAFGVYLQKLTTALNAKAVFSKLPDDQVKILTNTLALTWACKLGSEDCLKSATDQFTAYREKDTKIDPNLRSVVYCNGLRNSDNATRDFDFLWEKLGNTQISTETVTILQSLGCTKDKDVLKDYLTRTIADDSIVRVQDGTYPFSSVYSSNPEGVDVALDFITTNYKNISDHFGDSGSLAISALNSISGRLTTQDQIDKLEKFSLANNNVTASAVTNANNGLKVTESLQKDLSDLLNLNDTPSSAISYQTNIVLLVILYVIVKLN